MRIFFLLAIAMMTVAQALPALDWQEGISVRFAKVIPAGSGRAGFTAMPSDWTGIRFTNVVTEERGLTNQVYYSGSGVAAGDVDGDGWVDLYFCSLDGRNVLYRNLGNWKFIDTTEGQVSCPGQASTGAVFADVDGDGDIDLLVSSLGRGVRLFLNDGRGHFVERTSDAGLQSFHASMTMTLADVEGDGDLDLYVANNRKDTVQDEIGVRFRVNVTNGLVMAVNDRSTTDPDLTNRFYVDARGTVQENAEPDVLYLNDGHGKFSAVPWAGGTFLDENGRPLAAPSFDWGLSAMFRDMNGDGAPDLYVCNDGESPDRIWINDGHGRFRALSFGAVRKTCLSSMGVDFADINRDGFDDFFVADMLSYGHENRHKQMLTRVALQRVGEFDSRVQAPRNTLFLNRHDETYAEIAQFSGVEGSDWSWCPAFLDVDLDGYEDLIITTGLEKNLRDADGRFGLNQLRRQGRLTKAEFLAHRKTIGSFRTANFAFRNRGDLTFENVSDAWGLSSKQASHGIALADLDNDGDLDLVISCLNTQPLLYRNDGNAPRIGVRLKSKTGDTRGIGARIIVAGGPCPQSQEMICGGRYLSSDDPMRAFACGTATSLTVSVRWRNGTITRVTNIPANSICQISEGSGEHEKITLKPSVPAPLFSDASRLLAHRHFETEFDDFERQPTLTRRLSTAGPGIAWCDLDGDGREDLLIGCGRGGSVSVFRGENEGFERVNAKLTRPPTEDDTMGILAWPMARGTNLVLVAQSNYEAGRSNALFLHTLNGTSVMGETHAAAWDSSAGAVAMADMDGHGSILVFAAGRVRAGRYPEPATSKIFRLRGTALELDETLSMPFVNVGLVNSALFTDLDGDGRAELVLSCEWDSLRVFRFVEGRFTEITDSLQLDSFHGWWQGLAAGDFDGDGRMDLVASNWGRNHRYTRFLSHPIEVFFSGAQRDGTVEMFEAYHAPDLNKLAPARHWDTFAFRLPFLQTRVHSFAEFSRLGMAEIFRDAPVEFQRRRAQTFDSMIFLNRGDHFEPRPLPAEAQFAPAFGVCVADFDGDGHEDVFLAQNFFGTDAETSRHDAGRGLLLVGDGDGHFRATSARESGIELSGEGRGAGACDYDGDGRLDLCVGQNGAETKLYHNERALPGLRVRLRGTDMNLGAVGAVLRPVFTHDQLGPAREIHAGSGWLSQDSAVQVLASAQKIKAIRVRWPGGKISQTDLPPNAREVLLDSVGNLTVVR